MEVKASREELHEYVRTLFDLEDALRYGRPSHKKKLELIRRLMSVTDFINSLIPVSDQRLFR